MACEVTHIWSFTDLVGAYLDLFISFFLLSASFLVFFTSKFLAIFGLSLPCPCNGQFGQSNRKYCLQKNLLDCPIEKITSVQFSVKNKLPFDSIFAKDQNLNLNKKIDDFGKYEGEGSSSWVSDTKNSDNGVARVEHGVEFGALTPLGLKTERFVNKRSRVGIHRRKKGGSGYGKESSVSSCDPICADPKGDFGSVSSINKEQNERIEARRIDDEGETPIVMKLGYDGDEGKTQNFLKQALQEEQAARAALYLDLENERNAAATAADEAMLMIMRLQQEKAAVEMEAKQYQRLVEEKTAYDEEEMDILKEILLRKEREIHYLEKEVEAYRQMGYSYTDLNQLLDPVEDPDLMLHQLSESIDKKESIRNVKSDSAIVLTTSPPLRKELEEQYKSSKGSRELWSNKSTDAQEQNILEQPIPVVGEESVKAPLNDSKELRVLDVHVVDDNSKCMSRTSSDTSVGLPPMGPKGKSVISSSLRRRSMSALDSERLKLDSEVGWLRERLRTVQQGREKLNLSVDYKEIRQLTEPGKTSLPPLSYKATLSKKRRCRSASIGVEKSS